ncbi:GNAT superfamily N-acetyltransferase, partial [Undibacterium sp. GrIS 1.2]|uniref:GNAT family N-acetyltransferase n=2 Tax=Undibacterium TaxID=401469 RepID=UPI00339973CB
MLNTYTLRSVTLAEANIVASYRYYREQENQDDKAAYMFWLSHAIGDGRYIGLLAESNGKIVASAGMTLLDWGPTRGDPNPYRARIVNVYTEPAMRRQGIARVLVERLLTLGEQRGVGALQTRKAVMLRCGLNFTDRPDAQQTQRRS